MLPIVLVLLVASSALAAPRINLSIAPINEVSPAKGPYGIFAVNDGGDVNVYILSLLDVLNDLSNNGDPRIQALALGQTIAVLAALGNGVSGDACASSSFIDTYVSGNSNQRSALSAYVQSLLRGIDAIVQLALNPNAARFSTGPRGNCNRDGRVYNFEAAWTSILSSVGPDSAGLVNEEYCAAKRLYTAFTARSNNVGAAVTAASLPPVRRVVQQAIGPVTAFVRSLASGNPASTAPAAKRALQRAVDNS